MLGNIHSTGIGEATHSGRGMTVNFSRGPNSSPFGKLTAELKTRIPEQVAEDFEYRARSFGMTDAEYLREMVMVNLYGREHMASVYAARLDAVSAIGPECARNGERK